MSASEVMAAAKKFLHEDAGFERISISSVVAIEPDSKWKIIATVEGSPTNKKELVADDRDGKIISYKDAGIP
jgi:hypothetical protein